MTFDHFAELINQGVNKNLKENEKCKVKKVLKNNGLEMTGIYVIKEGVNISPTIYLDKYYEEYIEDKVSIEEVINEVYEIYQHHQFESSIDLREFFDYEKIKDRIIFKLINKDRNEELLADVPFMEVCDFAIIFQCLIAEEKDGCATITINNTHLDVWNISKEALYKQALINTPELRKCEIQNMKTVLCELANAKNMDILNVLEEMPYLMPMYVLTNRNKQNGASTLLYPDVLEKFAQAVDGDFFIIPSSIHELILIPSISENEAEGIVEMIKEINETEVPTEEVLSDSLYIFRKDISSLEIFSAKTA